MREEGRFQSNKNLLSPPQPSALSPNEQKPSRQSKGSRKEGARCKLLESVGDQKRERTKERVRRKWQRKYLHRESRWAERKHRRKEEMRRSQEKSRKCGLRQRWSLCLSWWMAEKTLLSGHLDERRSRHYRNEGGREDSRRKARIRWRGQLSSHEKTTSQAPGPGEWLPLSALAGFIPVKLPPTPTMAGLVLSL